MKRQAYAEGLRTGGFALAISLVGVLPGRWVLSGLGWEEDPSRPLALMRGLSVDAAAVSVPCAILAALCLLSRRRSRLIGQLVFTLLAFVLWVFMVSTTESSLSRGVFPSWVDLGITWRSPTMMRSSFDMFFLRRNVIPALVAIVPLVALIRWWPKPAPGPRWHKVAGALTVGFGALGLFNALSWSLAPLRGERLSTPFALFSFASLPEAWACARGPCEPRVLLERQGDTRSKLSRGANMLGWPYPAAAMGVPAGCQPHPFARFMPAAESSRAAPGQRSVYPRPARAQPTTEGAVARPLISKLLDLSDELWGSSTEPIYLWQFALEGIRGDEVHGINPAAPRAATPFLAGLYEQAKAGRPGVMASRQTWTAGVRTPHGVAALTCGLGTMPYGLALTRDVAPVRLRCLPDILANAGFAIGYTYGGPVTFDRMDAFLAAHSFEPWVSPSTLPDDVPQGAWGATDRAVFAAAIAATVGRGSSYHFVLSLSHHHPFTQPEDVWPTLASRVEQAFAQATERADYVDRQRLLTVAYTDEALREFFQQLAVAGLLQRSLIAITADHSIPDRSLWRHRPGALSTRQMRGLIPFILWLSPSLFETARHPDRARELATDIGRQLDRLALSQNDIPTLLLALLERSQHLGSLSRAQRWHSMGGQATSPWYQAPGPSGTRIYGIHAATALFFVDAQGHAIAPDEPAPLVVTEARAQRVTPSLQPAAAALAELLKYGASCAD